MFERNSTTRLWTTRDIPRLLRYWCISRGRVSIGIYLFIPFSVHTLYSLFVSLFRRKFLVPDVIEPVTTTMAPMSMTPIMIPTKKPSAANTLSKCSSYIPVDSQKNMYGMTKWCNKNCRRGYCPSSYCMCIP